MFHDFHDFHDYSNLLRSQHSNLLLHYNPSFCLPFLLALLLFLFDFLAFLLAFLFFLFDLLLFLLALFFLDFLDFFLLLPGSALAALATLEMATSSERLFSSEFSAAERSAMATRA